MRAMREAGQTLSLFFMVLLLASTAWVCLISASVVLVSHWLGTGLALLAVSGALIFLLVLILVVANAVRPRKPPPPNLAQRVLPSALAQGAMGVISHPLAIRAALLLVGVLLALTAVLLPGRDAEGPGPKS
jgi:hypothetical protein